MNQFSLRSGTTEFKFWSARQDRIDWHFKLKNRKRLLKFNSPKLSMEEKRVKSRMINEIKEWKLIYSMLKFFKMKTTGSSEIDNLIIKLIGDWRTEYDTLQTTTAKVYGS